MRIGRMIKLACLIMGMASLDAAAQEKKELDTVMNFKVTTPVPTRVYFGNGFDLAILSTALRERPGSSAQLTMPRFTMGINFGVNLNIDVNRSFGIFTGLGIKNVGFIEKIGDVTVKRRVYSVGVPLGLKIGDLRNRNFLFLGGGADFPINYREKAFEKRGDKTKFNEWFSDRTPRVMPFVFAGYSFDPGITLKLQYYPGNFLNPDFSGTGDYVPVPAPGIDQQPFKGYKVNLLFLSLGIDIHYNQYKHQEREYWEMRRQREQMKPL